MTDDEAFVALEDLKLEGIDYNATFGEATEMALRSFQEGCDDGTSIP